MANEHASYREREKKRRLDLARFTHAISYRILTIDGGSPDLISDGALRAFQKGSVEERKAYWQEEGKPSSFGQQMVAWIGEGNTKGMSQWVDAQKDAHVQEMLAEIGLLGEKTDRKALLENPATANVLEVINTDLQQVGRDPLTSENLSDSQVRSLAFYAANLTAKENETEPTRAFITQLVGVVSQQSEGDVDAMLATLQKISPLFSMVGEDAQEVLGALTVADLHGGFGQEEDFRNVTAETPLNDDEKRIVTFFEKYGIDFSVIEPFRFGEKQNLVEAFTDLKPDLSDTGTPYFVHDVPENAVKLFADHLSELSLTKPFWLQEGKRRPLNREIFEPAYVLENNSRFKNAEKLTYGDSGVFALAAASAETPEQQAALYQQLADVVVAVHAGNPTLLEAFIQAQTPESTALFINNETMWAAPAVQQALQKLYKRVLEAFQEKFGVPFNGATITDEQQAFIKAVETDEESQKMFRDLYENIATSPERLISLTPVERDFSILSYPSFTIDTAKTVAVWAERVPQLQEALRQQPPLLTLEQIHQLEFLAHSVDIVKLISWMGNEGTLAVSQPPVVEAPDELEAVEPPKPEGISKEPMSLETLFATEQAVQNEPGRSDLKVRDANELASFPTLSEPVAHFENVNDIGNLAIYRPD